MTGDLHRPGSDLDAAKLLEAIEAKKGSASFRSVAEECNVAPSTFTGLANGRSLDAVTLGRILIWLGESPFWMTTTAGSSP
jgi:hypothetical protein